MTSRIDRRRFLSITAGMLAAGPALANASVTRWRGVALGAEATIALRGPREDTKRALRAAKTALRKAEALFSLYDPQSALSRLNAAGELRAPESAFKDLLDLCAAIHHATAGAFDPTVQPLWRALAAGGDVDAAKRLIGWSRVRTGDPVRLGAGQSLTFNGIAQGFATDMVSEALAEAGFGDVLVNIGEFRAGNGDWRIGIEDPAAGLFGDVALNNGAIATSSPTATLVGGEPHILAPDGLALGGTGPLWSTVSVEAETAAVADGLSTAFCLMPEDAIKAAARRLDGVSRVTLVDASGDVTTLPL